MTNLANDFRAAIAYTQNMRDTFLIHFYRKYSFDGRYVFIDKSECSTILQKELAVDTVAQSTDGKSVCIEEKIEQWPGWKRTNFALETRSCTVVGRERPGWMHYAKADYLLYAFAFEGNTGLDVFLINFPKLREWFWNLPKRYPPHIMENTINHTEFEKVPIDDVRKAVPTSHYIITHDGCQFIPNRRVKGILPRPADSADRKTLKQTLDTIQRYDTGYVGRHIDPFFGDYEGA